MNTYEKIIGRKIPDLFEFLKPIIGTTILNTNELTKEHMKVYNECCRAAGNPHMFSEEEIVAKLSYFNDIEEPGLE